MKLFIITALFIFSQNTIAQKGKKHLIDSNDDVKIFLIGTEEFHHGENFIEVKIQNKKFVDYYISMTNGRAKMVKKGLYSIAPTTSTSTIKLAVLGKTNDGSRETLWIKDFVVKPDLEGKYKVSEPEPVQLSRHELASNDDCTLYILGKKVIHTPEQLITVEIKNKKFVDFRIAVANGKVMRQGKNWVLDPADWTKTVKLTVVLLDQSGAVTYSINQEFKVYKPGEKVEE